MPKPRDQDALRYYRVALQRLEDGALILRKLPERRKASMYLTFYAVECILKALLIVTTPRSERLDIIRWMRGRDGHDLTAIRRQLNARGVSFPRAAMNDLVFVSTWSVEMRYEPGDETPADAERFVAAAERLVKWAGERT